METGESQATESGVDETLDPEGENKLDVPANECRLGIAVLDWWEVPRWHEVPDEWSIWDYQSADVFRMVGELQRAKRMDT